MTVPATAVNRLTLREQVLDALREAITSGTLRPGTPLIETELAESYHVSRGTLREALRFLQQAGLVEGDARGKLRVHTPSTQEVRELFHVRAALESLAVREIIGSADRDQIVRTLRKHLPPRRSKDFVTALNLDLAFHELLCELSGNKTLHGLWKGLEGQMRIVLFSTGESKPLPIMSGDRHSPILDAIERGDVIAAYEVVSGHMEDAASHWATDD